MSDFVRRLSKEITGIDIWPYEFGEDQARRAAALVLREMLAEGRATHAEYRFVEHFAAAHDIPLEEKP